MHPFPEQYLPTDKARNAEDQDMISAKRRGSEKGEEWASKYLFHIPLERAKRKKSRAEQLSDLAEEEEEGSQRADPIGRDVIKLLPNPVIHTTKTKTN